MKQFKRIGLLIALMTSATFHVWSQPVYNSLTLNLHVADTVEKTIIREVSYPISISYVETPTEHLFVYHSNNGNQMTKVFIVSDLSVNDFVIENDTVFFCGTNTSTNVGFVGHFWIGQFFQASHLYSVTDFPFQTSTGLVRSFDKMVTFVQNGVRILAAVGLSSMGPYVSSEIQYFPANSICYFTTGELYPAQTERIYDIILTNHHVVTSGFKEVFSGQAATYGPILNFRVYPRNSMFAVGGPQDICQYVFPNVSVSADPTRFVGNQIVTSHMQADSFAVATYLYNNNTLNFEGAFMSIFDINSNFMLDSLGAKRTYQTYTNGGWKLRGLTPLNASSRFYLLQYAEETSTGQLIDMVTELTTSLVCAPYVTVPILPSRVIPHTELRSIDASSNSVGFVSNGKDESIPYYLKFHDATLNATQCFLTSQLYYYTFPFKTSTITDAFNMCQGAGSSFQNHYGFQIMEIPMIECSEE